MKTGDRIPRLLALRRKLAERKLKPEIIDEKGCGEKLEFDMVFFVDQKRELINQMQTSINECQLRTFEMILTKQLNNQYQYHITVYHHGYFSRPKAARWAKTFQRKYDKGNVVSVWMGKEAKLCLLSKTIHLNEWNKNIDLFVILLCLICVSNTIILNL